jgi:hypothetical protein
MKPQVPDLRFFRSGPRSPRFTAESYGQATGPQNSNIASIGALRRRVAEHAVLLSLAADLGSAAR